MAITLTFTLKVLGGLGAAAAGSCGGWYFYKKGIGGYGGWGSGMEEGDSGEPARIEIEEGRKFSEFSGYQNDFDALINYLNGKVNDFKNLSNKWSTGAKGQLRDKAKNFYSFFKVTYEQLKSCNCAVESGIQNFESFGKLLVILNEIKEKNESENISSFSKLFEEVYGDLERLKKLVDGSRGK